MLLKIPEGRQRPDRPKWVACYLKGWDGSPYYLGAVGRGGNAAPHSRKRFAQRMAEMAPRKEESDPFFTLDTAG